MNEGGLCIFGLFLENKRKKGTTLLLYNLEIFFFGIHIFNKQSYIYIFTPIFITLNIFFYSIIKPWY